MVEFPKNRGKAAVLNEIIPQCRADIVLLADARQRFAPDAVMRLSEAFADPTVGAVSGDLVLEDMPDSGTTGGLGLYWKIEKWIRRQESLVDSTCGCTGAIYAIRRELFSPIDPRTVLDDVAIPLQIVRRGKRVVFDSRAKAYDRLATDPAVERRRKTRTLAGCFQLCQLYPWLLLPWRNRIWLQFVSHKLLRLICPYLLLLALVSNAIWAQHSMLGRISLAVQIVLYALAFASLILPPRKGWSRLLGIPSAFLLLNAAAVAGFFRFLRGFDTGAWQPTASEIDQRL